MARVRITGLDKVTPQIKTKIGRAIVESGWHEQVRDDLVEEVRKAGIGPALSDRTIQSRGRIASKNPVHKDYISWFSNLTLTGQLLDSLKGKFQVSKLRLLIQVSESKLHKKYKPSKSKTARLVDIFKWQAERGRDLEQVFSRSRFIDQITLKLKTSIKRFYRN